MLSGRYRTERLCRFLSSNTYGHCLLRPCTNMNISEDISHILLHCPALSTTRERLRDLFMDSKLRHPHISSITDFLQSDDTTMKTQFLLDCSTMYPVIKHIQEYGNQVLDILFYLTRTWCYSMHRERLKQLGRWNFL